MIEPKFKKGDYIINRANGDMAIVKGYTKNIYYQFESYYGSMFNEFKNVKDKSYDLQFHYQKFYDLCTDEEQKKLDELIKEKGGK